MSEAEQVGRALARIGAPIFLARRGMRGSPAGITILTGSGKAASLIRRRAGSALAAEGLAADFRVVRHSVDRLGRYRSLESLVRGFGRGPILYDPTQLVGRAEALVVLGRQLRQSLGGVVEALFVEPRRRTLFVVVDRKAFAEGDSGAERERLLAAVASTVAAWRLDRPHGLDLAVRIGFEAPSGTQLVSIDRQTARYVLAMLIRRGFGRSAVAAAAASVLGLGVTIPAAAQEPAVSAPNMSLSVFGAALDQKLIGSQTLAGVAFTGAVPLDNAFGAQLDAAIGTSNYYGVGGHLFWRDPNVGLFGGIASLNSFKGVDLYRYGVEGQVYYNNFTLGARGGGQSGSGGLPSGAWGELDVTFYAHQNVALRAGLLADPIRTRGKLGFEWQPALSGFAGMSVFADAQYGASNDWQAMAGLTFHFGPARTLIDRDRRDDPLSLTPAFWTKY